MSSIKNDDDKTMTKTTPTQTIGLAANLRDGVALADCWGAGTRIGLGATTNQDIDIIVQDQGVLSPNFLRAVLLAGAARYFFCFGNYAGVADLQALPLVMETLIRETQTGFMAACFASPADGRTIYSGHLFQDGKLQANLLAKFNSEISGRAGLVPYEEVAGGVPAIRRRLAALKDQGVALALIDAVDAAQCNDVAEACAGLTLAGGPAWLSPAGQRIKTNEPYSDVGSCPMAWCRIGYLIALSG
jgi:hypothetical protein